MHSLSDSREIHVSVIVPCRNEIRYIRAFLDSLVHQDLPEINAEILVSDGMSDDGTREVLAEYKRTCPMLRVIDNPRKIASTALNVGIRASRGEVIIRMDAHSEYAPDYIQMCFRTLNETGAANVGGPALTRADGYLPKAIALAYGSRFARGGAKSHDPSYEGFVGTVTYGCWRKSTLEHVGMFDERFHRCQDNELNRRLIENGEKFGSRQESFPGIAPEVACRPCFTNTFNTDSGESPSFVKHGRPASWRQLIPTACLLVGVGLLMGAAGTAFGGPASWKIAFDVAIASFVGLYCLASVIAASLLARREGLAFSAGIANRFCNASPVVWSGLSRGNCLPPYRLGSPVPFKKRGNHYYPVNLASRHAA